MKHSFHFEFRLAEEKHIRQNETYLGSKQSNVSVKLYWSCLVHITHKSCMCTGYRNVHAV